MADFYAALYEYQHREYERYQHNAGILSMGLSQNAPQTPRRGVFMAGSDHESPPPGDLGGFGDNPAVRSKLSEEVVMHLISPGIDGLLDIMARHHPGLSLEQLRRAIIAEPGAGNRFVDALLDKDFRMMEQLSAENKTGAEEAVFILVNWLKPFFIALREHNRELIPEGESGTDCPVCGYYADMAALNANENGKRYLHCSLCEHLWQFKRVACSVCGTVEAGSLEYLAVEGEAAYRIDTCDKCGGYIKTVRIEKFEDIDGLDLTVENIITPHLDSAALRKGYRRP
jgi:formate dehydrogenase accessory protein FdhE